MTVKPPPAARLHIERLELDLRGIAPATASAAAQLLGPALRVAFTAAQAAGAPFPAPAVHPADRLDAGRIASPAAPQAGQLAATIAGHLATTLRRGQS